MKRGESAAPDLANGDATDEPAPRRRTRAEAGTFAKRLGQIIHGRGMRQSALARAAGLEPYLISNYVLGKAVPSRLNLEAIAKALEVSPESLLAPSNEVDDFDEFDEEDQSLSLAINKSDRSTTRLQLNVVIDTDLAVELVARISKHLSERAKRQT